MRIIDMHAHVDVCEPLHWTAFMGCHPPLSGPVYDVFADGSMVWPGGN